jgi:2-methylisocitrate lyase-like PEP mutase family enzyme
VAKQIKPGSPPELAERFRELHQPGAGIFLVPSAWDAASARIFEDSGAKAIGTTSLGLANTLGYADGESCFPAEENLRLLQRIVAVCSLPVTGDLEAMYDDPEGNTEAVIEAGAVGLNIEDHVGEEDGVLSIEDAAARVAQVRETADRIGFPLFINARTETLRYGGDLEDAIMRMNTFLEAGAECCLPILPAEFNDAGTIREIVERVNGPINAPANAPLTVAQLEEMGVRRIGIQMYPQVHGFVQSMTELTLDQRDLAQMRAQRSYGHAVNDAFKEMQRAQAST